MCSFVNRVLTMNNAPNNTVNLIPCHCFITKSSTCNLNCMVNAVKTDPKKQWQKKQKNTNIKSYSVHYMYFKIEP